MTPLKIAASTTAVSYTHLDVYKRQAELQVDNLRREYVRLLLFLLLCLRLSLILDRLGFVL
ncbi:hypothetical protein [Erwinia amylovora]